MSTINNGGAYYGGGTLNNYGMTYSLEHVNAERAKRGLPPLGQTEAYRVASQSSGFNTTDFLIGYMTGIPMPSPEGIVGAVLHDSGSYDSGGSSSDSSSSDYGSSSSGADSGSSGGGDS